MAAAPPAGEACWRTLLLEVADEARRAVEGRAADDGVSPRELACTLIVVVASRTSIGVVQIGDGGAVVGANGTVSKLTSPILGEYINETTFLTSPGAVETAQVQVRMIPVDRVAAMTDGLQMLALEMPSGEPFLPFFKPLFAFAAYDDHAKEGEVALAEWMASSKVTARTDDDTTLLLAVRVS
jgi:hypothetical protein